MSLEGGNFYNFWGLITEANLREDGVRDFISRYQPEIVFYGIKALEGLENKEEIARKLAVLIEINVENPQLIGASHSVWEAIRLRRILDRYRHYQANSHIGLYERLISDLEANDGLLKYLTDLLQQKREGLGIASPFPTEMLVEALANEAGIHKNFESLTLDDWERVILSFEEEEVNNVYDRLLSRIKPDHIWTTTGVGRNLGILQAFEQEWRGGAYIRSIA